jgi:hypothetical protein
MVANGKTWRQKIWDRKEAARIRRMPEKTPEQLARQEAENYIRSVDQEWNGSKGRDERKYSPAELLFVMLAQNQLLACEIAIRKIELQKNLPIRDRKDLQKAKASLAERRLAQQQEQRNRPPVVRFQTHV